MSSCHVLCTASLSSPSPSWPSPPPKKHPLKIYQTQVLQLDTSNHSPRSDLRRILVNHSLQHPPLLDLGINMASRRRPHHDIQMGILRLRHLRLRPPHHQPTLHRQHHGAAPRVFQTLHRSRGLVSSRVDPLPDRVGR